MKSLECLVFYFLVCENMPELMNHWRELATDYGNSFLEWIARFPVSLFRGELFLLFVILIFIVIYFRFKSGKQLFTKLGNSFILLFEMMFEKIYDFFIEIIGEHQKYRVKSFVIGMFFVILFSNLMGTLLDFVGIAFPGLEEWIIAPTTDANFNIAMAVSAVLLILYLQMKHLGVGKFFYEYVPLLGKGIITIEKGNMSKWVYYPVWLIAKLFDILISLFVGALDIIGNFAKVISLSFRLTGNMMSGTILLWMLVVGLKGLTSTMTGFEFPVLFPLLIVLQGVLVAVIQAFVFALLTAIFIKVATE